MNGANTQAKKTSASCRNRHAHSKPTTVKRSDGPLEGKPGFLIPGPDFIGMDEVTTWLRYCRQFNLFDPIPTS